jgi:hypothetical protein
VMKIIISIKMLNKTSPRILVPEMPVLMEHRSRQNQTLTKPKYYPQGRSRRRIIPAEQMTTGGGLVQQ